MGTKNLVSITQAADIIGASRNTLYKVVGTLAVNVWKAKQD